ncbi:MAG: hypothetical protein AAGI34_06285 [Pseudomonadota bacterium]
MRHSTLRGRITALFLSGLLIQAAALVWLFDDKQERLDALTEAHLATRARVLAVGLAGRLDRIEASLGATAAALARLPLAERPALLEAPVDALVLWTALVRPDGSIGHKDNPELRTEVGQVPWFQLAATGLAIARPGASADTVAGNTPIDAVDLGLPVRTTASETPQAVLAAVLDWPGLAAWLDESAADHGLEARILRPDEPAIQIEGTHEAVAAVGGGALAAGLGLSVKIRDPAAASQGTYTELAKTMIVVGLISSLFSLALLALFARVFLAPLSRQVLAATAIARGESPSIEYTQTTAETALLGSALHEIVSRLDWHEGRGRCEGDLKETGIAD